MSYEFEAVIFNGYPNYMVATGIRAPEQPYFFLQEKKPSKPDRDPEDQLLAALIVATALNHTDQIQGAYVIGQLWFFVLLQKIGEKKYEYMVSKSFDALKINDLQQIYINLQAIKASYIHKK